MSHAREHPDSADFGDRCIAKTKAGKRCRKSVVHLKPVCVSRESWLAALRTGWPVMVLGMKQPEYKYVGFCCQHCFTKDQPTYGVKYVVPDLRDPDVLAAVAEGQRAREIPSGH